MTMHGRKILNTTLKCVLAYAVAIILLFPIYWMVITSFKEMSEIYAQYPTFWPQTFNVDSYVTQITDTTTVPIWYNLRNSIIVALSTTILSTVLSTLSAYGLARYNNAATRWSLYGILVTQMMPATLFLSPLFIIFTGMGLFDTFVPPVVYVCLHSIPFCVITLRPYFLGIPKELEDSAIIDGCNKFTAFLKIMVPISYPGIVVAAVFTFMWGWGDLMGALTFIRSETLYPLTMNMYKSIGEYGTQWNKLMAYAVIVTAPVILIMIFLQRYLVSGLTSGAVKG